MKGNQMIIEMYACVSLNAAIALGDMLHGTESEKYKASVTWEKPKCSEVSGHITGVKKMMTKTYGKGVGLRFWKVKIGKKIFFIGAPFKFVEA